MERMKITFQDADTGRVLKVVVVNEEEARSMLSRIQRPKNFWEFMAFLCTHTVDT